MIICGKHIRHQIRRNLCKAMLQTLQRDEPVVAGIGTRQRTPRQRWLHDWELDAEEDGRARHPCTIGRSGIAGSSIAIFLPFPTGLKVEGK